jgi:threonine dehydratase
VEMADKLAAEHGYVPVPPYNDEKIIAGQGTIGLEILEDLKDVDLVLVQVSGGGLISGIATAIKAKKKKVKIYGVEPEIAADARDSLHQKKLVKWDPEAVTKTIADGMRTTPVGEIPFQYIQKYVDDIVTVTEDEIRAAVKKLALECRIIAEPSGATTAAAFFYHRDKLPKAKKTVAVISGGNIAPEMLREILG